MPAVERARVLAFRLSGHNLIQRLGPRSLLNAAAASGIQETPLGSAVGAFGARVEGMTPAVLERALFKTRTMAHLWSLRGAPYLVPVRDLGVFTVGALPVDRASFDHFLGGWAGPIERAGLDPFDLLDTLSANARVLLDGQTMGVNELRDEMLGRARALAPVSRPKGARHDMPEPLFRAIGLVGAACIVEGRGTDAVLARTDQWLEGQPTTPDVSAARAEFARRFLHCYGPSTPNRFAEWTTRSLHDARHAFDLISDELVEIESGDGRGLLLAADQKGLESPPSPQGTRLLPAQDPYLQQRDRATVLTETGARRKLWKAVRGPGGVLHDGELVGTWRSRIKRSVLEVSVDPFVRLGPAARAEIAEEAERLAPLRGCEGVELAFVAMDPDGGTIPDR